MVPAGVFAIVHEPSATAHAYMNSGFRTALAADRFHMTVGARPLCGVGFSIGNAGLLEWRLSLLFRSGLRCVQETCSMRIARAAPRPAECFPKKGTQ